MEQIRTLDALLEYAKEVGPKKISVACAEDAEVMEAVENARKAGVANAFLVGDSDKIKEVTDKLGIDLANYDVVDEGNGKEIVFVEMSMLHWPDSMAAYLTQDNILFSNDAFGQHYATEKLFNDLVDQCELFNECIKYYANILTPFSAILRKKLAEVLSLNLQIDIIATSHGVIWRDNPMQIVEKYSKWADDYQENQISIIYDTMWNGTKQLAEKIAEGIALADGDVTVKLFNLAKNDDNDVITEVFKSKTVVIGSPTVGNSTLHSVAGFMHLMKGLKFKNKKAAAFGCYGWSGEGTKVISESMKAAGFDLIDEEGFRHQWNPDGNVKEEAVRYGMKIAKA